MRKIFSLLLFAAVALAATAVDYRQIEVDVTMDPSSYRALLERFEKADTTLTPSEMATVYFGYAFSRDYDPRDYFPEIHAAYDRADYEEVARLVEEALPMNPVSLDLCLLGLGAYEQGAGKTPGARSLNLAIRSDLIATAILKSGRGTNSDSPFYVICDTDRRRIFTNVLGVPLDNIIGTTHVGPVQAFKFTFPGQSREHILYFDNTLEERFLQSHPR